MAKRSSASLRSMFGSRVRELRRRQKLSLEELGGRAELSSGFVQNVETGKQAATLDTVEKLAKGLDVAVADLFQFTESAGAVRTRTARMLVRASDDDVRRAARVLGAILDF